MDDLISRQAALTALEETKQSDPFNRYEYQNIGIDWSIDAIKALPSAQPDVPDTNVGDMISRQAALDAIKKLEKPAPTAQHLSAIFDCEDTIKALPPTQLAQDLTNGCTDTISRAAVGDALNRIEISRNASWYEFYQKALTAVGTLPSAQPNLDEWCDDCKEYDKERHCCPRWNRVIRQTVDDVKKERKPCNGCKHMGNDFKCNRCVRAAQDNYEPWEGGQDERFD